MLIIAKHLTFFNIHFSYVCAYTHTHTHTTWSPKIKQKISVLYFLVYSRDATCSTWHSNLQTKTNRSCTKLRAIQFYNKSYNNKQNYLTWTLTGICRVLLTCGKQWFSSMLTRPDKHHLRQVLPPVSKTYHKKS